MKYIFRASVWGLAAFGISGAVAFALGNSLPYPCVITKHMDVKVTTWGVFLVLSPPAIGILAAMVGIVDWRGE